ncbi:hypothetical protein ISF_09871 [Cordyceps fumosorosea ARSEF 2679]|uniref:DUF3295 domain-containing protein n=1 Tax=Cordyceps fumosorosea (strain ARSEF 2679) TaxID=1081104 RepID=A0A167AH09_CORFA|nr:hypothetical protein ISF_09871 [Cordyceps fumosorosea ARSEF 2679]OAA38907.1 hypothetical protein ISF_09871 [Cordyceps fumosorosea ARSEF 2679]
MPSRLYTHVLTVGANAISEVDTAWTDSLEQGRRVENVIWKVWQREQLVDDEKRPYTSATAHTSPLTPPSCPQDLPQLSGSIDSLFGEDATESVCEFAPMGIRPRIHRPDSTSSHGRRNHHIIPDDLKKIVVSIVNDTAPLSAPTATSPLAPKKETAPIAPAPTAAEPTTNIATKTRALMPSELPVHDSSPQPSQIEVTSPESEAAPAHQSVAQKKAAAKFALGGSCSSSEQRSDSSGSASTKSDIQPAKPVLAESIASTSRKSQPEADCAIDSDTDDDYVGKSAVDDDDSSDWEDSTEESGKSSVDEKFFQRIEPEVNLISRPSLISLMFDNKRITLGASPNNSDEGPLMMKDMRPVSAQPIIAPTNKHPQAGLSPRTTRRNMLATELTESLRRHLLWERQQKTSTANAVLKRRHTSHDVANLKQFRSPV